jgi:PAS domain-containing protein
MPRHVAQRTPGSSRHTPADETVLASFAAALHAFYDPVVVVDHSWRFLYANEQAQAFAARPAAELIGRTLPDLCPQLLDDSLESAFRDAIGDQKPRKIIEHLTSTDTWYTLELYPTPVSVLIHWREVTEEHHVLSFNDRLLQALESRLEFIAHRRRAL